MGLFNNPRKSSEKLFNKYIKSMFKKNDNGKIHILDAPFKVPKNYNKLNRKMNYLIDGMRLHNYKIVRVDPKFINNNGDEICNLIIIYK